MKNEKFSKDRHDILNGIASLLAQVELLKRKDPQITDDLLRMQTKLNDLHHRLIDYFDKKN